jgi:predicted dehydrogenase
MPPAVQSDFAVIAARRGKAVLLEKPIAGDLAGAQELAAAIRAASVISQLALVWRYTPAVRRFLTMQVPKTWPQGGSGRIVSTALSAGEFVSAWRRERCVLKDEGSNLVDLLDAALGHVVGVQAHGDPQGGIGLLLEHEGGRFSEASMFTTDSADSRRADIEVFGPGGAAAIDCTAATGSDAAATMVREFATAVATGAPHELDVRRGLRLQQILEAAETELLAGS